MHELRLHVRQCWHRRHLTSASLQPTGNLAAGVYAGMCDVCHTKVKFRVAAAPAPMPVISAAPKPAAPAAAAASGCCGGQKAGGCCGGKSATHNHHGKSLSEKKPVGSPDPVSSISFTLNGKAVTVNSPDPTMSLNEYIRTVAGLTVRSGFVVVVVVVVVVGVVVVMMYSWCWRR